MKIKKYIPITLLILIMAFSPLFSCPFLSLTNEPTNQQTNLFPVAQAAERLPRMYLLGEAIHPDPLPIMRENRLLIPLRVVAESAGAAVSYNEEEGKAIIENKNSIVEIWSDRKTATVNGISRDMDVPAVLQDGRLFIPLRFWLENAGFTVLYKKQEGSVFIEADTTPRLAAKIVSFQPAQGEYYPGDEVLSFLTFVNTGNLRGTFWVGCSVRDMEGRWYDITAHSLTLNPEERVKVQKRWEVPVDHPLVSGPYQVVMAVWDAPPGSVDARRLAQAERESAFTVFNVKEDFSSFDHTRWVKGDYRIGESDLCPHNVAVHDGKLRISVPAGTLEGGSIRTREHYLYGSYRASIKVANAPSSITGFFLYKQPDYYHEIDIEIYNDNSRRIMFVTYAEGKRTNRQTLRLNFDPTAAFHEYRFDFYSSGVHFYVDDRLLKSWPDGLTDQPMQLMLNTWFPQWLDAEKPQSDRHTYVEWIRY